MLTPQFSDSATGAILRQRSSIEKPDLYHA